MGLTSWLRERQTECDHEWEEKQHEGLHPHGPFSEKGEIFTHLERVVFDKCVECGKIETKDVSQEKVYFSIERTEEMQ